MDIEDVTHIDAPVETVWALTVDLESWPATTPTVDRVERLDDGPLGVGSTARLEQPGQPARTWTVTAFEPNRHFAWSTQALGATMTGVHLIEADGDGTRQTLRIDLAGWPAPLLRVALGATLRKTLAKENAGFKRAAEAA